MNIQRIVSIVLIAVGVILLIVGISATDSVADRLSNFFTGHYTETTAWYLIGGAAAAIGGVLLFAFGGRRRST